MFSNIKDIMDKIAQKDEVLARIFKEIMEDVVEIRNNRWETRELYGERRLDTNKAISNNRIEENIKITVEDIAMRYNMNLIPSDLEGKCEEYCIAYALGKWNAKAGFKGIVEQVIELWLGCYSKNRGTIIITDSWDGRKFLEDYRRKFDNYCKSKQHSVCVVLIGDNGCSLQYLN